nr:histidine kinase [uncultured Roseateles sp.]
MKAALPHAQKISADSLGAASPMAPEQLCELAQTLHGELAQLLSLALIQLRLLREHPPSTPATSGLDQVQHLVQQALQTTRGLLQRLEDLPAQALLPVDDLARELQLSAARLSQGCGHAIRLTIAAPLARLPHEVNLALLEVGQELLLNACKHGLPGSVAACLVGRGPGLSLKISSQGRRADPEPNGPGWPGESAHRPMGLSLAQARLSAIGARLRWRQAADGSVHARVSWTPAVLAAGTPP